MKRRAGAIALVIAALSACSAAEKPRPTAAPKARVVTPSPMATDDPTNVYASIAPGDLQPSVRDITPRVYVPNSESDTLDVIDPKTYTVIDHRDVGDLPQHVTPSWDMKHLYVNNNRSNTLTELDPQTGKRVRKVDVDDPYNLYFTPDGTRAIVVAERLRKLDFYDPRTWKLVGSVPILHLGPNHLDFSRDGSFLIVSCEFSGYIVKIDVRKMEGISSLEIGGKPTDVRLSPDGTRFFVANETRNGVSIVDPDTMKEERFIPTGAGTHGFVVSRDGKSLYVTNRLAGSVSVIDFATRQVTATWNFGGSPDMGGVTPDGRELWLSGRYHGVVYVIDTGTGALKHTIRVGNGPHGVCFFPQPGRYSLGHTGNFR